MALIDVPVQDGDDPQDLKEREAVSRLEGLIGHWREHPVDFVCDVLGAQPDPWQCDVMDTVLIEDNVALKSCHGAGKTALLSWLILWFMFTHKNAIVPTTAPTFNKQVRDVLWGTGVHKWFEQAKIINPWIANSFELNVTRMHHVKYPATWFAVGIATGQPMNAEGYHGDVLVIIDEAKKVARSVWESIQGMRTSPTDKARLVVASTPGGKSGEFFKVFTEYRETWKSLFTIHAECTRESLKHVEAPPHSNGGCYYSNRISEKWVRNFGLEQGTDSAAYVSRCLGEFPDLSDMNLIPYEWLRAARVRKEGTDGEVWVSCDVARFGRDRTVFLVGKGGTILHGETIARVPSESFSPAVETIGVGLDPKRPAYRTITATIEICRRLRLEYGAVGIVVDESGLGQGLVDGLKKIGERVEGIHFGAVPSDRPREPEDRKRKQDKHQIDSVYRNIKAEMGWALRGGFESNAIALGNLPAHILDPLVEQCSLVELDMDASGRMNVIDPDEQEEIPGIGEEARRSPDHFHSLILLWWKTGGVYRRMFPRAGAVNLPSSITQLGQQPEHMLMGGQAAQMRASSTRVAGQAAWIQTRYR